MWTDASKKLLVLVAYLSRGMTNGSKATLKKKKSKEKESYFSLIKVKSPPKIKKRAK